MAPLIHYDTGVPVMKGLPWDQVACHDWDILVEIIDKGMKEGVILREVSCHRRGHSSQVPRYYVFLCFLFFSV